MELIDTIINGTKEGKLEWRRIAAVVDTKEYIAEDNELELRFSRGPKSCSLSLHGPGVTSEKYAGQKWEDDLEVLNGIIEKKAKK